MAEWKVGRVPAEYTAHPKSAGDQWELSFNLEAINKVQGSTDAWLEPLHEQMGEVSANSLGRSDVQVTISTKGRMMLSQNLRNVFANL